MSEATPTRTRRPLAFARLSEVMPEVDRLLLGHRTAGDWGLGQICNHLADTLIGSVDGFDGKAPWPVRRLVGPLILSRLLKKGTMPEGIKPPGATVPRPGLDARAEAEALRAAIRSFEGHAGPLAEHPVFGTMTRRDWERLHCLHSAHHLSFAHPAPPAGL